MRTMNRSIAQEEVTVRNEETNPAMTATVPAFPMIIRREIIRRLIGWLSTSSASLVVNPVPVRAERA